MAASWAGAMFGAIFSSGVAVEMGGGLNFVAPLAATFNEVTKVIDVTFDAGSESLDYDNSSSGLTATNVQDAIDEIAAFDLSDILAKGNSTGAHDISVNASQAITFAGEVSIKRGATAVMTSSAANTTVLAPTIVDLQAASTSIVQVSATKAQIQSTKYLDFVGVIDIRDDDGTRFASGATQSYVQAPVGGTAELRVNATVYVQANGGASTVVLSPAGTTVATLSTTLVQLADGIAVRFGSTNPAVSGDSRHRNNTTMVAFRDVGNTKDIAALRSDNADGVILGDEVNGAATGIRANTTISHRIGAGATVVTVTRSNQFEIQAGFALDWASGTASLSIADSNWMTSTSSLTTVLTGALGVGSGTLSTTGAIRFASNAGDQKYRNNGNTADIRAFAVNASDQVLIGDGTNNANVAINASTSCILQVASSSIITASSTTVTVAVSTLTFANTVTSPLINQANNTTSDATAQSMIVAAQNVTGAGTTVTGGDLTLRGGNASTATATNKIGGNLNLQGGTGDATNPGKVRLRTSTGTAYLQVDEVNTRVDITSSCWLNIVKRQALGGGAAPTLGTIGGSGPTTAAQNEWAEIKVNGNTRWVPVWA